jgi:hypothetical protein
MKTIAIPTLGWSEDDCDAFEQYVIDVAADFYTEICISHTCDSYFEIDIDENDSAVQWLIVNAAGTVV